MHMTLWLYSLLTMLLQPVLRWKLRRRGRHEGGYLHVIEERFGRYADAGDAPSSTLPRRVWVHAVSMGETRAAAILIAALREKWPGMRLLLTHSTATGRAEGAKLLQPGDSQVWLPWDTPGAVNRFLQHFAPGIGILVETELWPNLLDACRRRGLPVALVNARMNQRSLRLARILSPLSRPAYRSLSMVLAQTEEDAARLRQAGCKVDAVYGNLKFDAAPDPEQLRRGQAWRQRSERSLLLFASSREGEEQAWLEAWDALSDDAADVATPSARTARWLLVPRHPQRFDEVARLIEARGLTLSRCSDWSDGPDARALACDVWLGDSLGNMALYYAMSDAALLGGSFAPLGGHNLIEAAACGCPLVMGPNTFNFAEAATLARASGAAVQAQTMVAAMPQLTRLLASPEAMREARQACQRFSEEHRGCTARTVAALATLLPAVTQ